MINGLINCILSGVVKNTSGKSCIVLFSNVYNSVIIMFKELFDEEAAFTSSYIVAGVGIAGGGGA